MIGVVVVTHGQLARELLSAAEAIVGDLPRFAAVSIGWHDDVEDARGEIRQAVARCQEGQGVIVLTDMFGGTPTNLSLPYLSEKVEIVTGVNLPMLIKALALREGALVEIARAVREQGKGAIYVASEVLARKPE